MKKNPIEIRPVIFDSRQVELLQQGKLSTFIQLAKLRCYPSLLSGLWTDDYVLDEGNEDWLTLDCPFGKSGHKLFVREKFAIVQRKPFFERDWEQPVIAYQDFTAGAQLSPFNAWISGCVSTEAEGAGDFKVFKDRWLSPVCMSMNNSRHLLTIDGLELKRLHAVDYLDLLTSGFQLNMSMSDEVNIDAARDWLSDQWEEKHGVESWKENPLVWVVSFQEIHNVC